MKSTTEAQVRTSDPRVLEANADAWRTASAESHARPKRKRDTPAPIDKPDPGVESVHSDPDEHAGDEEPSSPGH